MDTITISDEINKMYGSLIKDNPLLNAEEEIALSDIIINNKEGKQCARETLLKANIRLVIGLARQTKAKGIPLTDLIGGGILGLLNAIDRFNPAEYKTKLSTYANSWIKLYINKTILEHNSGVHIPQNVLLKSKKYYELIEANPNISRKKLMKELDVSDKALGNIENCSTSMVSMDAEIGFKESSSQTLKDIIEDTKSVTADNEATQNESKLIMLKALSELEEIPMAILTARYLSGNDETLETIGTRYGICKERVRQIQAEALDKMKKKIEKMNTWGY